MSASLERLARHVIAVHDDARKCAEMVEDKRNAMLPPTRASALAYLSTARYALMMAADALGKEAGFDAMKWLDGVGPIDPSEEETVRERGGTR